MPSVPNRPFQLSPAQRFPLSWPTHLIVYLFPMHEVTSVMSDSLQPYALKPTRLLCPWDSPSKNTGVGNYTLPQGSFPTQGLNPHLLWLLCCRWVITRATWEAFPTSYPSHSKCHKPLTLSHSPPEPFQITKSPFFQNIFIEYLLCAWHCIKHYESHREKTEVDSDTMSSTV